jgi:eukaryotic-like serine/threonine-protein kinase
MGDSAGMAETGNRQGPGRVTPEQWEKVKEVLVSALELAPENRRAYLDRRCTDLSPRREVESLVAAHENGASQFMGESSSVSGPGSGLADGEKLGAYVILGPLGAGGVGEVYRPRPPHR